LIFKDSFYKRKCVIPANGYYEWKIVNNEKVPYFFHIPKTEPIFFAGIWKYLNPKENINKVFSIITKKSNPYIDKIHHRMPVLLSIEESLNYLNDKNSSYIESNFTSSFDEYINFFKVSKFVNNPLNNSDNCIKFLN